MVNTRSSVKKKKKSDEADEPDMMDIDQASEATETSTTANAQQGDHNHSSSSTQPEGSVEPAQVTQPVPPSVRMPPPPRPVLKPITRRKRLESNFPDPMPGIHFSGQDTNEAQPLQRLPGNESSKRPESSSRRSAPSTDSTSPVLQMRAIKTRTNASGALSRTLRPADQPPATKKKPLSSPAPPSPETTKQIASDRELAETLQTVEPPASTTPDTTMQISADREMAETLDRVEKARLEVEDRTTAEALTRSEGLPVNVDAYGAAREIQEHYAAHQAGNDVLRGLGGKGAPQAKKTGFGHSKRVPGTTSPASPPRLLSPTHSDGTPYVFGPPRNPPPLPPSGPPSQPTQPRPGLQAPPNANEMPPLRRASPEEPEPLSSEDQARLRRFEGPLGRYPVVAPSSLPQAPSPAPLQPSISTAREMPPPAVTLQWVPQEIPHQQNTPQNPAPGVPLHWVPQTDPLPQNTPQNPTATHQSIEDYVRLGPHPPIRTPTHSFNGPFPLNLPAPRDPNVRRPTYGFGPALPGLVNPVPSFTYVPTSRLLANDRPAHIQHLRDTMQHLLDARSIIQAHPRNSLAMDDAQEVLHRAMQILGYYWKDIGGKK